jgi:hypothetical protein
VQRDEGPACRAWGRGSSPPCRGTRVQPAVQGDEGPACRAEGRGYSLPCDDDDEDDDDDDDDNLIEILAIILSLEPHYILQLLD